MAAPVVDSEGVLVAVLNPSDLLQVCSCRFGTSLVVVLSPKTFLSVAFAVVAFQYMYLSTFAQHAPTLCGVLTQAIVQPVSGQDKPTSLRR